MGQGSNCSLVGRVLRRLRYVSVEGGTEIKAWKMEDEEIMLRLLQGHYSRGKIVTTHENRSSLSDPVPALTDQEPPCQAF